MPSPETTRHLNEALAAGRVYVHQLPAATTPGPEGLLLHDLLSKATTALHEEDQLLAKSFGLPTTGYVVLVNWKDADRATSAAFFYLVEAGVFACTDAASDDRRWVIEDDTVEQYLRRALEDSKRGRADDVVRQQPAQPSSKPQGAPAEDAAPNPGPLMEKQR